MSTTSLISFLSFPSTSGLLFLPHQAHPSSSLPVVMLVQDAIIFCLYYFETLLMSVLPLAY